MKISCDWLSDYLGQRTDAARAGEALTMAGYPVEEVARVDGDEVMEVEVTSNRPDLLSHVGVARELAAVLALPFVIRWPAPAESAARASDQVRVAIERPELCPHYTARLIRGVRVGPSPDWMQRRLRSVGLRPINNVVDVTNYVLFETGQPLHAFDFDKLAGARIVVRAPRDGERLRTLDGVERALSPDMLCICDADRPVALAGVMGGESSEVSGTTVNVLLESARFDPQSVRGTSRKLRLSSDASHRFERGLDPTLARRASVRTCALILETAGGEMLSGFVEAGEEGWQPRMLELRFDAMKRLLGVELPPTDVTDALRRLELSPEPIDGGLRVTVPSHRLDLNLEVDLIEEAVRLVGYDKIPLRETITVTTKPADPVLAATGLVRDAMTAGGYFEAVTFSFVSDAIREAFLPTGAALRRVDPSTRKADGHLRPSLLPGLCESLRHNETVGNGAVRLFEIGSVFYRVAEGPVEQRRLAIAGGDDYHACRGMLEAVLSKLDASRAIRVEPAERAGFGSGACGRVSWGEQIIGHVGKLDRAIADRVDLRHLPAMAEVDFDALLAGYRPIPAMRPLPRFPSVRRDVSLLVEERVAYADLESLVRESNLPDVETVEHSVTYRGKPLATGQKSITLTLVFRSESGTLTREHADAAVASIVAAASAQLGAQLRQ